MKSIILFLIRFYKKHLWFLLGGQCRFRPTCSQYTSDAVKKYGTIRGLFLGIKRILNCYA
ncbi:MAG: membrane protein insertion efficiency factor YidD [Patescibacteria group bacterium]